MTRLQMETVSQQLVLTTCAACAIQFAVPASWDENRRETGDGFWCPNGHSLTYKGELERLCRELTAEKTRRLAAEDQRQAAEKSASALRGQVTKMRRRAAAGVCPCCHRTFQQLARHMANKHPSFTTD